MERVDLDHEYGKVRHQQWRSGWTDGPYATLVAVGQLADGRWFALRQGRGANWRDARQGACVYAGPAAEHYARGTAGRWMRAGGSEWAET